MASSIHDVFNNLVASDTKTITIQTGTQREHDNLRTRLVKLFKKHKSLLESIGVDTDDSNLSLGADFSSDSGTSKFSLRIRRTKYGAGQGMKEYTIITDGDLNAQTN